MQKLYFLFFLVLTLQLSAQHTSITAEDFNHDGIEDQLKCTYEIGSTFGGGTCELVDGKTKTKFKLSNYGCYCAIKKRVYVHPELRKKENEYFLFTLKKEILPQFKPIPDQSLYWIIKSGLNTSKLQEHPYFELIFEPGSTWRQGEPELPFTYSIDIAGATLSKIVTEQTETSGKQLTADHKDYLVYYGDTHFAIENETLKTFIPVTKNESYELLKTAHGVVAKKGNTHKWLFVSDMDINASPQKLRWASIEEVFLYKNMAIVKQNLAPDAEFHIYAIDIETGKGGNLVIDFDLLLENDIELTNLKPQERFSIQNKSLVIGNQIKIPLEKIQQELMLFTKGK